jgi:beta-N-acetylhexosaminidase
MMKVFRIIVIVMVGLSAIFTGIPIQASQTIDTHADARTQAELILNQMTPEERVGQLFLVTFQGMDISPTSQIYDLIANRHIGGVILSSENNNIPVQEDINQTLYSFTSALQNIKYEVSNTGSVNPQTGIVFKPQFIPLFIGISQEGNGYPTDQILSGLTALPSQMTIGATWQTDQAYKAGTVLGKELQSIGINLLLGPSLDVLDSPRTEGGLDLGVRTFGGDPYWVGVMASAYISGVHQASQHRILVVSKHFPGYGSSDRLPGDEVATVRKSLEQLKQIELAPFLAVCGNLNELDHVTDALLVSHIRFQGFQGNIRATTRPVSFDATALSQLTSLPEISEWREQGGLFISDDLGSRAVRRFFDPAEKVFDPRQVTRNAFLAGNDILYMGNMRSNTDPDSYTSILHTLDSFTQKYREDPTFAARVDESALNVLTQKVMQYPSFNMTNITKSIYPVDQVGASGEVTFNIIQKGATLISPDEQNLAINLPNPPTIYEDLIFFTSTLTGKQCTTCNEQAIFAVDGLERAVMKNYGPPDASQVRSEMLSSYSFKDLTAYLANGVIPENLEHDLPQADWLVFAVLDVSPDSPETAALKTLLENRYDLVRNKKVIVFAFSAPYYYDATDISKITAYYGVYSKVPSALDVAARILFHEITPRGASPVTITGAGYDLIQVTSPDPDQIIPLALDTPEATLATLESTAQPTDVPLFRVGDKLPLKAGVILDRNANPVPDGTTVRFIITRTVETSTTQQVVDAVTSNGIATGQFTIDSKGLYDIKVVSEPAMVSNILQLNVTSDSGAIVTAIAPTPVTETTPNDGIAGEVQITQTTNESESSKASSFGIWIAALLVLLCEAAGAYYLLSRAVDYSGWSIRAVLLILITGWLAYLYMAFGLPGSDGLPVVMILFITFIAGGIGLIGTLIWRWWLALSQEPD